MMLKVAVRFCGVLVLLLLPGFSTSVRAQSDEDAIYEFSCVPDSCADNYGPSTTGDAFTSIKATCNNGTVLGPKTVTLDITVPCTHPVLLETSAEANDELVVIELDCGHYLSYYLGDISVSGIVIDTVTNTEIYNGGALSDCLGGVSPPVPVMGPC
jgi:hypothetical protein